MEKNYSLCQWAQNSEFFELRQKKNTQRKINTDLHVIFHWQKIALHYLTESLMVNHNTKLPPTVPTVENNFLICMDQKQTETQTPIILI